MTSVETWLAVFWQSIRGTLFGIFKMYFGANGKTITSEWVCCKGLWLYIIKVREIPRVFKYLCWVYIKAWE